jgi:hypothetical protein
MSSQAAMMGIFFERPVHCGLRAASAQDGRPWLSIPVRGIGVDVFKEEEVFPTFSPSLEERGGVVFLFF